MDSDLRIGTAGWTIPATVAGAFPQEGSGLARYAARLSCAEINSSFHRSHREATWRGWAQAVPEGFLFSAKLSKAVTHGLKLRDCAEPLAAAIAEMRLLGERLGVVLVQLPPSLQFDAKVAEAFFAEMRRRWEGAVACEPRHASWFEGGADALLEAQKVARVAADPARAARGDAPGGWRGLAYFRLHGSPVMYRSSYDDGRLEGLAARIRRERERGVPVWCIFDNTASSGATANALKLADLVEA
ncbi:MAG TPA: DUF72 domain-containing protein [Allosphingosinicella sp.]|nr:DUF72 domain-containing protein [Allosphingosinicella sp.]